MLLTKCVMRDIKYQDLPNNLLLINLGIRNPLSKILLLGNILFS